MQPENLTNLFRGCLQAESEKSRLQKLKDIFAHIENSPFHSNPDDIIGSAFEKAIETETREKWGQFYTPGKVIDLILTFCLHIGQEKVLDPCCGTGPFLLRVLFHKIHRFNQELQTISKTIQGYEISPLEATIAELNLYLRGLKSDNTQPLVQTTDFFQADPNPVYDCVVANPPYTRQENIGEVMEKSRALTQIYAQNENKEEGKLSKRAGIYAYFILHAWNFLRDGGYLGFIVPNAWLDTEYGRSLQQFLLTHFSIIAIIDSKKERWFADADINTCILILRKEQQKLHRENNYVRFVLLNRPLSELYTLSQTTGLCDYSAVYNSIITTHKSREFENFRLTLVPQALLSHNQNDRLNIVPFFEQWGIYLRAPEIFYTIWHRNVNVMTTLERIAKIRSGIKSGANQFFYCSKEHIENKRLEHEFWSYRDENGKIIPNYILKSPRECQSVVVDPTKLKWILLLINREKNQLKGTQILEYIQQGESQGIDQQRSCKGRPNWYQITPQKPARILWEMIHYERLKAPYNPHGIFIDHNLFEIIPHQEDEEEELFILAILNSTYMGLIRELFGRFNLGDGSIKTEKVDIERFPIPDPRKIPKTTRERLIHAIEQFISRPKVESLLMELGAAHRNNLDLSHIKADRKLLDDIILREILHLSEDEVTIFYRSVVDLIQSRVEKAKTYKK
jgi:tRNA1(Val) A37 N6-methylase TrmN6